MESVHVVPEKYKAPLTREEIVILTPLPMGLVHDHDLLILHREGYHSIEIVPGDKLVGSDVRGSMVTVSSQCNSMMSIVDLQLRILGKHDPKTASKLSITPHAYRRVLARREGCAKYAGLIARDVFLEWVEAHFSACLVPLYGEEHSSMVHKMLTEDTPNMVTYKKLSSIKQFLYVQHSLCRLLQAIAWASVDVSLIERNASYLMPKKGVLDYTGFDRVLLDCIITTRHLCDSLETMAICEAPLTVAEMRPIVSNLKMFGINSHRKDGYTATRRIYTPSNTWLLYLIKGTAPVLCSDDEMWYTVCVVSDQTSNNNIINMLWDAKGEDEYELIVDPRTHKKILEARIGSCSSAVALTVESLFLHDAAHMVGSVISYMSRDGTTMASKLIEFGSDCGVQIVPFASLAGLMELVRRTIVSVCAALCDLITYVAWVTLDCEYAKEAAAKIEVVGKLDDNELRILLCKMDAIVDDIIKRLHVYYVSL